MNKKVQTFHSCTEPGRNQPEGVYVFWYFSATPHALGESTDRQMELKIIL